MRPDTSLFRDRSLNQFQEARAEVPMPLAGTLSEHEYDEILAGIDPRRFTITVYIRDCSR